MTCSVTGSDCPSRSTWLRTSGYGRENVLGEIRSMQYCLTSELYFSTDGWRFFNFKCRETMDADKLHAAKKKYCENLLFSSKGTHNNQSHTSLCVHVHPHLRVVKKTSRASVLPPAFTIKGLRNRCGSQVRVTSLKLINVTSKQQLS